MWRLGNYCCTLLVCLTGHNHTNALSMLLLLRHMLYGDVGRNNNNLMTTFHYTRSRIMFTVCCLLRKQVLRLLLISLANIMSFKYLCANVCAQLQACNHIRLKIVVILSLSIQTIVYSMCENISHGQIERAIGLKLRGEELT